VRGQDRLRPVLSHLKPRLDLTVVCEYRACDATRLSRILPH
jgi:hypothetical protein